VYQFTSSRPRHSANARQTFLLQTRDLIASRFRKEHHSLAPNGNDANVYPYFVGVFDTVASLLDPIKLLGVVALFIALDLAISALLIFVPYLPITGRYFSFLSSFTYNVTGIFVLTALAALFGYVVTLSNSIFECRDIPGSKPFAPFIGLSFICNSTTTPSIQISLTPSMQFRSMKTERISNEVGWYRGETDGHRAMKMATFFEQV
jgi:hypothetical protein